MTWKRLRLAAQLKAAVEQLDLMILSFEDAMLRIIEESKWPMVDAQCKIADAFNSMVAAGKLEKLMAPKDWSRFAANVIDLVRASTWSWKKDLLTIADAIIYAVETELSFLGSMGAPRSISIWQFTFASLCKAKIVQVPLTDHRPVITTELEGFYPIVKEFAVRFDFNAQISEIA